MARVSFAECCGVGEVVQLGTGNLEDILRQARRENVGMLTAYFLKNQNPKLMAEMKKHGFKKLRSFVNPNTGHLLHPLVYVMKVSERASTKREREDIW